MAFDPDAYLAGNFNPDEYLGSFDPDQYLGVKKEPSAFMDLASTIPFSLGKAAQGIKQGIGDFIGDSEMSANAAAARAQIEAEEKKVKPDFGEGLGSMAYGGVKSTLQAVPAIGAGMINPALGLGMIGASTGADAYGKYRGRGATPEEARIGGLAEGAIEAGTELIPFKFLLKNLGKEGFTNFVKGMLIREVPGEQVATLAQDAVDTAIANPEKTWVEYWAERPKAAAATLVATGVQTGLMGGASAVGARLTPVQGPNKPKQVENNLNALDKQKELQKQTQGEGTLYVGKDGDVTTDLPAKVQESQGELDLVRTELQNRLQEQATTTEGQDPQLPLFDEDGRVVETQLDLGLKTEPLPADQSLWPVSEDAATGLPVVPSTNLKELIPAPHEVPKWQDTLKFIAENIVKSPEARKEVVLSQRSRRSTIFDDNSLDTRIPFKLKNGTEVVQPDGSVNMDTFIKAMFESDGTNAQRKDLLALLKDILPYVGDVQIKVLPENTISYKKADGSNASAPAVYKGLEHTIEFSTIGFDVRTAAHELVHAATVRLLNRYIHPITGKLDSLAPTAVKELHRLYEHVKNKAEDLVDKNGKTYYSLEGGRIYGLSNVKEFAAEVLTNRYLQKILNDMPSSLARKGPKAKSILDKFVEAVGKLFGLKDPNTNTILKQAITAIDGVIQLQTVKAPELDLFYKTRAADPSKFREFISAMGENPEPTNTINVKVSDPETVRADQVEKISGEIYLSKDPVIDDALINKIKQEKDGSNIWALTPGALARSELAQSTLVKTVYRLYNNAFKRADFKNRNVIQPVERSISKLINSGENGHILHDVLMRELKNKTDYTADELRSAGVSDNVIVAHLEFRAMMQEALDAQNAARRAKGLKPITAQEAYISARWSGPWRANIKDSEGKTVWQVAEHSKAEAKRAIDYILSKEKNLVAEEVKYKKGMEKGDGIEASYLDMLELLDADDPRIATLRSIYEEYIQGTTEDVANQEKHFKRKTGVRGFAGDRPWAKNDTKEFFIQQFDYAKNAFKWAEAQAATEKASQLLNNPEILELQKNNIQYSKEYAKNQLGYGTAGVFDAIDNSIAEAIGRSPGVMQQALGTAKNFFYLTKLSMSFPFMATQFLQPAITTPAWHAQLDSLGYKHNPAVTTLRGIGAGASAALWHYAPDKFHRAVAEKAMSPLELEATKYLEANAIIDINPLSDIKKELRAEAVKKLTYVPEQTLRIPEVVARSVAFMSFVSHLQQSGKYDTKSAKGRMALFEKAEEMTSLSMTDYRAQERAIAFERGGLTGDAAATLHAYQLNNLMQLTKFFKEAGKGNVKPLATMVGMQALAAGALGLWFVEDLDDLYEMLISFLPDKEYMEAKKFGPKTMMLNNLNDWLAYGAISTVTGTNIQTRMKASDQLPDIFKVPPEPGKIAGDLFPFAESVWDTVKLLGVASPSATPNEKWQDIYKASPVGLQGPMESLPAFNRGEVSLKPSDLSEGKIVRTPEERNLRNIGMKSLREQRATEQDWQMTKAELQINKRMKTASEKAKEYFTSGNPERATEQVIKYVNLGGDPQVLLQGVDEYAIKQLTTELQRRQIKASSGTLPAVLKLQRYLEFHGNPTNR